MRLTISALLTFVVMFVSTNVQALPCSNLARRFTKNVSEVLSHFQYGFSSHNHKSVACMAALVADTDGNSLGDGYSMNPFGVTQLKIKNARSALDLHLCSTIASDPGVRPVVLSTANRKEQTDRCEMLANRLKWKLMNSKERSLTPLKTFVIAMESTNNDVVLSLNLLASILWEESHHNPNRFKSRILQNFSPVSTFEGDLHGQYYHWWGEVAIYLVYGMDPVMQLAENMGSYPYELFAGTVQNLWNNYFPFPDSEDLSIDFNGRGSGPYFIASFPT